MSIPSAELVSGPVAPGGDHAARMDRIYRMQKFIYDATRKYYLLGRDQMIEALDCAPGDSVLEIGCGTGRNLALVARRYPDVRLFGVDISAEMLRFARQSLIRRIGPGRVHVAQGDARHCDPSSAFAEAGFDRIVFSYAVSMIPEWVGAVDRATEQMKPGAALLIVDFGDLRRWPSWAVRSLDGWLGLFHVRRRLDLAERLGELSRRRGLHMWQTHYHGGYCTLYRLVRPRRG